MDCRLSGRYEIIEVAPFDATADDATLKDFRQFAGIFVGWFRDDDVGL